MKRKELQKFIINGFQERMFGTVKDNFTVKSSKIEALSEDSDERSISNE